jgi:hypothetical protein
MPMKRLAPDFIYQKKKDAGWKRALLFMLFTFKVGVMVDASLVSGFECSLRFRGQALGVKRCQVKQLAGQLGQCYGIIFG